MARIGLVTFVLVGVVLVQLVRNSLVTLGQIRKASVLHDLIWFGVIWLG